MSIATMKKADRSATSVVYVAGFVPSHLLPNKTPSYLDPFLEPLLIDVENLFIEGRYKSDTALLEMESFEGMHHFSSRSQG